MDVKLLKYYIISCKVNDIKPNWQKLNQFKKEIKGAMYAKSR